MAHIDGKSIRIRVKVGASRVSKNLPANTPAREIERLRTKMKLGLLDPSRPTPQAPMFRTHAAAWLEVAHIGFSTRKKAAQLLRDHILPELGGQRLDEISPADILDMVQALTGRGLAPQSIGNILSVASNVFKDAILRGLIQVNPTAGIRRLQRRQDTLTDEAILCWSIAERDQFLSHARDVDFRAFQVAAFTLFTGLRPSEVRGLLRDSVDWDGCCVTVRRQWCTKQGKLVEYTKGRRSRTVPIPRAILSLLADKRGLASDQQLFPGAINSYGHRTLRPLMEDAGVRVVTFHGLRHTFASQLYEATKDVLLVKETLGHRNIATTDRYLHRLNSKLLGSTDGLLAGATFLGKSGTVVALAR